MKKRFVYLAALSFVLFFASENKSHSQVSHGLEEVTKLVADTGQFKSELSAYPYVYYTPETKFAFGVGGIFIFYTKKEENLSPSKITLGGYYSTTGQYKITLNNVFYFNQDNMYLSMPIEYGYFVDRFWGVGNNTPDSQTTGYTQTTFSTTLTFQIPPTLFEANRTGILFDYYNTTIEDKKENELLINDAVIGSNGGSSFGIGGDLIWDSRDNIFFPNSGGYQYFKTIFHPGLGDFNYALFQLDVRQYYAFKKNHVIAGNFFYEGTSGDAPFNKLPALGGQNRMRGFFQGRYRDNNFMALQLEYRQYFYKRFGFVAFGGMGDVADEIMSFRSRDLKYSYGGGLRFLFNKKQNVNLRMDFGFGSGGNSGIYFGIEEAF